MTEDKIERIGRREIIATAANKFHERRFVKAMLTLAWIPLPLRWSRARLRKVSAKREAA